MKNNHSNTNIYFPLDESETSENNEFKSYIKDIFLELPDYKFEHKPITEDDNKKWVGRKIIQDKLYNYLDSGNTGAYLITGYRGMGKTSFVRKVVNKAEKESKFIIKKVIISFGQKDIKELDILRQIINGIKNNILHSWVKDLHTKFFRFKILPVYIALTFILLTTFGGNLVVDDLKSLNFKYQINSGIEFHNIPISENNTNTIFYISNISLKGWQLLFSEKGFEVAGGLLITSILIAFLIFIILLFIFQLLFPEVKKYDKLDDLYDRCRSQITKEAGSSGAGERFPFGLVDKQVKRFPLANPKEVENEIIDVLEWNSRGVLPLRLKRIKQFIFLIFTVYLVVYLSIFWLFNINPFQSYQFYIIPVICLFIFITTSKGLHILGLVLPSTKFNKIQRYFSKRKFIFVFDEIDKVDPSPDREYYHEELDRFEKHTNHTEINEFRERKKVVINILANLKYLITTAEAKFVFIAGREMFDAALADIADRQSAVSSIFHEVINVDSFLKDSFSPSKETIENRKTAGLTGLVEEYLEKILLLNSDFSVTNKNADKEGESFVRQYYLSIEEQYENLINEIKLGSIINFPKKEAWYKIIYTLQNFIVYLSYRSNGSPKKLVRLIEEMIIEKSSVNSLGFGLIDKKHSHSFEDSRNIFIYQKKTTLNNGNKRYFLKLNFNNQYRLGLISYLYRPFLASYGNYYKAYSDKILVSTPYLLDHIIKFHPFAFSMQNLELVPEILSETRSPELRNFVEDLVIYLSQNHIRDTEIGLFDFKFLHKTYHEIVYLSKIFENESAAFNFTLDETFHVKLHLRARIKEARSIYKEFIPDNKFQYIKSISMLNDLLGDAEFFDQEYDSSLASYSDAIEALEENLSDEKAFNWENFIFYVSLQLKIGLTYEKMKAYEKSISIYIQVGTFIGNVILKYQIIKSFSTITSRKDLIQLIVQPFIAELYVLEKVSVEGATLEKIINTHFYFKRICKQLHKYYSSNKIIAANYYSNIGTLLHYKNSTEDSLDSIKTNFQQRFTDEIKSTLNISDLDENKLKNRKAVVKRNLEKELNSDLKEFDNSILEFQQLTGYKEILKRKNNSKYKLYRDYKVSPISYAHFKKGIIELLDFEDDDSERNIISILKKVENIAGSLVEIDLLKEPDKVNNNASHDKTYLKNLAILLYKLGDSLFSAIRTNLQFSSNGEIELVDINLLENIKINFTPFFKENSYAKFWSFHEFEILNWQNCYSNIGEFQFGDQLNEKEIIEKFNKINSTLFQLVMCINFWSAQILIRIGKNITGSFMFRKIIHSFRLLVDKDSLFKYEALMETYFLNQVLQIASWNSNASDRYQIYKYKYNLGIDKYYHPIKDSKHNYMATSNNPEIKEGVILLTELKLKALGQLTQYIDNEKLAIALAKMSAFQGLITPYNNLSTQYVRYHELRLQNKLNEQQFSLYDKDIKNLFSEVWVNRFFMELKNVYKVDAKYIHEEAGNLPTEDNIFCNLKTLHLEKITDITIIRKINYLIINSIFCLNEIIKLYNGFGVNYLLSFSSLGTYHRKLGDWLKYYQLSVFIYEKWEIIKNKPEYNIKKQAENLVGADIIRTMDTTSEYQLALQNYTKARQLHSEGSPYKNQTLNMYYLEDDFNDSLYHFSIAIERQRINSGKLRKYMKNIKEVVNVSQLYDYFSYVNNESL